MANTVDVKADFGAAGNGSTNDTQAFQNALASGKSVFVPAGVYNVTGIVMSSGQSIRGASAATVTIRGTSTNTPVIRAGSVNSQVQDIEIRDLTIDRVGVPSSGGHGIFFDGSSNAINLRRLFVRNQFQGLRLGCTFYSTVSEVVCENNYDAGIYMSNFRPGEDYNAVQWYLNDIVVQKNDAQGIVVFAKSHGVSLNPLFGVALGDWVGVRTFANKGVGIGLAGVPGGDRASGGTGVPINGLRLRQSFSGENGNHCLYLETKGGLHQINDSFFENSGKAYTGRNSRPASPSGPAVGLAPTGAGAGIYCVPGEKDVTVANSICSGNSQQGIYFGQGSDQPKTATACTFVANDAQGIYVADGNRALMVGNSFSLSFGGSLVVNGGGTQVIANNLMV